MILFLSPSFDLLFFIIYLCKKACWQQSILSHFSLLYIWSHWDFSWNMNTRFTVLNSVNSFLQLWKSLWFLWYQTQRSAHNDSYDIWWKLPIAQMRFSVAFHPLCCTCIALNTAVKTEPERNPALSFLTELHNPKQKQTVSGKSDC